MTFGRRRSSIKTALKKRWHWLLAILINKKPPTAFSSPATPQYLDIPPSLSPPDLTAPPSLFDRLPVELFTHINKYLRYIDAVALKCTCRFFFQVVDPGPKPKIPRTLQAWGPWPVNYKIVMAGWEACGVLFSLQWGIDVLDGYLITLEFGNFKQVAVDGQTVISGFIAASGEECYSSMDNTLFDAADGVIVAYNLLSRATFDEALKKCCRLQEKYDSEQVGIPVLLLGVNINNRYVANANNRYEWNSEISREEASEAARSIKIGYCEARIGNLN